MDQSIPPTSGWKHHSRSVDKLLQETQERGLVSAMYLHGQPVSGLSTTLVDHVVRKAKAGAAPPHVIYIAAGSLEMACLCRRDSVIDELILGNDYTTALTIRNAEHFVGELIHRDELLRNDVVLMIDVKMAATVFEEVMFGLVLNRLREAVVSKQNGKKINIAVLLLGSWFSERTYRSFQKVVQIVKREIPDYNKPVSFETFDLAHMNQLLEEAVVNHQRVLFSADLTFDPYDFDLLSRMGDQVKVTKVPRETRETGLSNLLSSSFVHVDPATSFSTAMDVSMVVSSGSVEATVFDPETSQLVLTRRSRTRCELNVDQAWTRKATVPARLLTSYTQHDYEMRPAGDEMAGSAWSEDLMAMVLFTLKVWEGKNISELPIRRPVNDSAWADRCRRLSMLGCIARHPETESGFRLTERGDEMGKLVVGHGLKWDVAWLLVTIKMDQALEENTRRVLIYMAAVLTQGPNSYIAKTSAFKRDGSTYTTRDLQDLCCPILQQRASYGMLWLFTGIFLMNIDDTFVKQEYYAKVNETDVYITISKTIGRDIKATADTYFGLCSLDIPSHHQWTSTPLSEAQLGNIDLALTWAFLHNTVYFMKNEPDQAIYALGQDIFMAKDCVSLHDVRVDQKIEFLDVASCREHSKTTTDGGGFHAIFRRLRRKFEMGHGYIYTAEGLTWLPPACLSEVERQTNHPWPGIVMHNVR
ncbi:hypothetical protein F5Y19DRAFT_493298 [Xylariaceae sp. FL1651]|nr:hypothetical protein F5Y19DRAFT_493298 [Xylariaceae sp. FL1651]